MAETKVGIILEAQDRATRQIRDVSSSLEGMKGRLGDAAEGSKKFALGIAAAVTAVGGFIGYGAKVQADLQTAQIGLTTLLGSAEEAGKTVERIKVEAARTPFELVGLTQAVQLLSSVTKSGDKAVDVVLDIGEGLAAMGKGQAELDRIIVNLQQIASVGKAATIDIKQFAFSGIPIYEMLTEQTGLAGEALGEFIENGGVSFDLITEMFDKANDAGGRFFNAYVNQAGSFNQSLSNLKDSTGLFLAKAVESTGVFDMLTSAMGKATEFLDKHSDSIANSVKWLSENKVVIWGVVGAIVGGLVPALYVAATAINWVLIGFILAGAIIAVVIYAMVKAVQWLGDNWDEIKQRTVDAFTGMKDAVIGFVNGAIDSFKAFVTSITTSVKAKYDEVMTSLIDGANTVKDAVVGAFLWLADGIVGIMNTAKDNLLEIWNGLADAVKFAVALIAGLIIVGFEAIGIDIVATLQSWYDTFVNIFNAIKEYVEKKLQEYSDGWEKFKNESLASITAFTEGALAFFTGMWEGISGAFTFWMGIIQAGIDMFVGYISQKWSEFWGGVNDTTSEWSGKVQTTISKFWNGIKESYERFTEPMKAAWTSFWGVLGETMTGAWENVKATVKSSINWLIEKINAVISAANSIAQKGASVFNLSIPQFDPIPMLAQGGVVTKPTLAMIGEGGEPEAVIPLSKLGSLAGAGGNITINITGTFLSEDAGLSLGDQIIEVLRRNMRI